MRIRTVKPEFWSHPVYARLQPEVQLLALAIMCHADDEGYFNADPAIIRGACMPYVDSIPKISGLIRDLYRSHFIEVKEHPEYGQIGLVLAWKDHQRLDHPKPSKIKKFWSTANCGIDTEKRGWEQGTGNRDICAEEKVEEILLDIPTRTWSGITASDRSEWSEAYPNIDIRVEMAAAAQWCASSGKRGQKKHWRKFLTNWLANAQRNTGAKPRQEETEITEEVLKVAYSEPEVNDRGEDTRGDDQPELPMGEDVVPDGGGDHPDDGEAMGDEDAET